MKKKMLVIIMPAIEGGGVEKNLFIISNYLAKNIKNVYLINASRKFNKKFKKIKIINPVLKFWDNLGRKGKYFICLFYLIKMILQKKNIAVLCFQANLYCTLVCKFFGIKIITRSNSSPTGWSKNIIKTFLFKKILKLSDLIIVNSIEFKKELKKKFNVNSTCIYNPLNKNEIIKLSKKRINISFYKKNYLNIINVGRYADQKDQITLLKALNFCKSKIKFKLLCIGRGDQKQNLLNYIKENSLTKSVKLLNFSDNPYKFIRKSDLFILTSKFEGLPNVLLESIALKKFIISSNCPTGPKEILNNGKGGILFQTGNYRDLSRKIYFYIRNKKKLNHKISFAYKNLDRFDYNTNLKKYLSLINDKLIF